MTVVDLERASSTLDLRIEGARLTPLGLDISEPISFEDYESLGWILGQFRDLTAWALGDWLIFGEASYGDKYAQAIEATGRSKQTLKNYQWVSSAVPRSRRVPGLTWTHHRLVAKLAPDEQARLLAGAKADGLSVEEFSGQLRGRLLTDDPAPPSLREEIVEGAGAASIPGGPAPAGHTLIQQGAGVAGIDFDTYKATIAVLDFDATIADVAEIRFRKDAQSGEVEAYEAVKRIPRLLWDEFDWTGIGVAWIERGRGKGRNADWALGRVQGALTAALIGSFPVNEIPTGEWRKELFGKGSGGQEELVRMQREALTAAGVLIRRAGREPVSPMYAALSKDDLDAVSIAYVGREQNVRAVA